MALGVVNKDFHYKKSIPMNRHSVFISCERISSDIFEFIHNSKDEILLLNALLMMA